MDKYPKLTGVQPQDDYKLLLTFDYHIERIYDLKPNLKHNYYSQLSDVTLFNNVKVVDGEILWITGQDFCPNTLFDNSMPNE